MSCSSKPTDERICDVVLRDGSTLAVRPVPDDDINALVRFFTELSPESRHYRFLGTPTIDSASIAQLVPLERGLGVNDAAGWKDVEMPADTTPSVPL